MKPTGIPAILDMAQNARKLGENLVPLFTGEAGLGKSELCQQWVAAQRKEDPTFGFLDLRIAYLEAPDLVGFVETEKDEDGLVRTKHRLPEYWPTNPNSKGLILLEEPNRGTTGVMNCLMQLLTDRKVHNYTLPAGWIIAGCINPDSSEYDVNTMDVALRDRFQEFEVEYDAVSFLQYMEKSDWDAKLQRFVGSGIWIYKTSKEIAKDGKYISPRTLSKLNGSERAGIHSDRRLHRLVATSILGRDIGNEYHKFCYDQAPVTAEDLIKNEKAALKKLKDQSDPSDYKGDLIAATVESIVKNYGGLAEQCEKGKVSEELMAKVAKIIPSDHAVVLVRDCGFKISNGQISTFFKDFVKRHPDLIQVLKDNIKVTQATK
jgi:hypothetical protein